MRLLPDPAKSRAVIIGVSHYSSLEDLPAVANNLTAFAATLRRAVGWNLAPEHISVLTNPTHASEILDAVRDAGESATDTVLVYFAGHGLVDPNRGGLFLGLPRSVQGRPSTGLPYDWLRDTLIEGRAGRQVVLLDCCFSGRALGMMGTTSDAISQAEVEGSYLLASASETAMSLAKPGEAYTAFTGELLEILNQGIPGGPEYLDLDTVHQYLYIALRAKGRPLPQKRNRNMAGRLVLSRNVAATPAGESVDSKEVRNSMSLPHGATGKDSNPYLYVGRNATLDVIGIAIGALSVPLWYGVPFFLIDLARWLSLDGAEFRTFILFVINPWSYGLPSLALSFPSLLRGIRTMRLGVEAVSRSKLAVTATILNAISLLIIAIAIPVLM